MENIGKQIKTLVEGAVDYGKTTLELTKLNAVDKISDVASKILARIAAGIVLLVSILFASIGLAYWLGEILGKIYLGFLAVAVIYGFLFLMIRYLLGKWVRKVFSDYIIKKILD